MKEKRPKKKKYKFEEGRGNVKAASCEKIYQMAAIDLISQKLDIFLLKGVYWECCPATLGFYGKDFNSPVQKKKKKEKKAISSPTVAAQKTD